MKQSLGSLFLLMFCVNVYAATEKEGNYLYRVTMVRAAPGKLVQLIELYQSDLAGAVNSLEQPFLMRHSQGDQWDLLLMYPMGSSAAYFHPEKVANRHRVEKKRQLMQKKLEELIAYKADLFALGTAKDVLENEFANNSFYHVEMFHSLPGKRDELMRQRRMENTYLAATGQTDNYIFKSVAGTDVDVFTVGFYSSIVEFAAPAPVSDEQAEKEAKAAGFEGRSFIGTYLRSLISGHHDTLAVAVE